MLTPHPSPLYTRDDMARAGWLIIAAASVLAVFIIAILGDGPK